MHYYLTEKNDLFEYFSKHEIMILFISQDSTQKNFTIKTATKLKEKVPLISIFSKDFSIIFFQDFR